MFPCLTLGVSSLTAPVRNVTPLWITVISHHLCLMSLITTVLSAQNISHAFTLWKMTDLKMTPLNSLVPAHRSPNTVYYSVVPIHLSYLCIKLHEGSSTLTPPSSVNYCDFKRTSTEWLGTQHWGTKWLHYRNISKITTIYWMLTVCQVLLYEFYLY